MSVFNGPEAQETVPLTLGIRDTLRAFYETRSILQRQAMLGAEVVADFDGVDAEIAGFKSFINSWSMPVMHPELTDLPPSAFVRTCLGWF